METIKLKIQELAKTNAFNVNSISYGYKLVNNVYTDELCIRFGVNKKKSISELSNSEIIPSSITLENQVLKTDVIEASTPELLVCNGACGQNAGPNSLVNRTFTRPLVGGLSISSTNVVTKVGTLGFIGVHTETQALVGVTNNHVVIRDAFYTSDRNIGNLIQNEYAPIDSVYQHGESAVIPPPNFTIGQTLRYVPISVPNNNKVDCAIFSVNQADIDQSPISSSVMQAGVAYTAPLPFATTLEIDNLLNPASPSFNPMLFSSGRTTGPKGGILCPLRVSQLYGIFLIPYSLQGVQTLVWFEDQIGFEKPDPNDPLAPICPNPIIPGDSGSALIADFGGVRKIIGLVFAATVDPATGQVVEGWANRIDNVASEMGIEAWDGTNKNYVDPLSIQYITTVGGSTNKFITCATKDYWQVGLTTLINPC